MMSADYDFNKVAICGAAVCGRAVCGYDRQKKPVSVRSMVDDIQWLLERNGYTVKDLALCNAAVCGRAVCARDRSENSIAVYKRNVPPVTENIIALISSSGSMSELGNVPIDYPMLTVVSQSLDILESRSRLKEIHDLLLDQTPFDTPEGVHYYHAKAFSTGQYERKTSAGPVYVMTATFEIKHQSMSYEVSDQTIEGTDNIDVIALYVESIVGQRCYRGQMPPAGGTVFGIIQTGGNASDDRVGASCLTDYVSFDVMVRGEGLSETNRRALDLQRSLHLTRHVGRIGGIRAYSPTYTRGNIRDPRHTFTIPIETEMERI